MNLHVKPAITPLASLVVRAVLPAWWPVRAGRHIPILHSAHRAQGSLSARCPTWQRKATQVPTTVGAAVDLNTAEGYVDWLSHLTT